MKIVFLNVSIADEKFIKAHLTDHDTLFLEGSLEENEEKIKEAEILSVFVDTKVSKDDIEKMPHLKMIATRSTGFDHIDVGAAKACGVEIMNVSKYGTHTVAEFTFALILAISRKVSDAYSALRQRGEASFDLCEGFDIYGKTIGIVGAGGIGKSVARIAKGFGMNIRIFDRNEDAVFSAEVGAMYVSLEELVADSDIITLHVPYNEGTHHLINKDLLSKFKKGSYLINTSRGKVVDTLALIKAIKSGHIQGAGLDVLEHEEKKEKIIKALETEEDIEKLKGIVEINQLLDMDNVIVTPHVAFDTIEAKKEIIEKTLSNIEDFVQSLGVGGVK